MTGYGDKSSSVRLTVLLAEDDPDVRSVLAATLRRDGHHVVEVQDEARLDAELSDVGVIPRTDSVLLIADVGLRRGRLALLDGLARAGRLPALIVMSSSADDDIRTEAARLGAVAFFDKPFAFDDLRRAVRMVQRDRAV